MTKVAVIILNWNGREYLRKFLPSVTAWSDDKGNEIIVADNHSDDGSVEFLRENYPKIRIILFERNYGFAEGYRKALEQIDSLYYVMLNSDVEVTPGWLQPLIVTMEKDDCIAACMPKIRALDKPEHFEYAGAAGGFIDRFGYPFCRGRILDHLEKDEGQYDVSRSVFWASGACLAIRSTAYHEVGGLDDLFFAHMEEIDLCWRLHSLGKKVYCVPGSVVYHLGGGSLPNNHPRKIYLNHRNNLYMLLKNLPAGRLLLTILARMVLDGISALIYLLQGNLSFFAAVFRAHMSFYWHLPQLIRRRKQNPKPISFEQLPELYPGSIVIDYFLRNKKRFSQLRFRMQDLSQNS